MNEIMVFLHDFTNHEIRKAYSYSKDERAIMLKFIADLQNFTIEYTKNIKESRHYRFLEIKKCI